MAAPERIGRYRVLGLIGQGAMGVVYRGRDDSLDRDVALKLVRGAPDAEARERFLREARAAARLPHPNIVTIYEAGEHEGAPFMAMELLEGVDLQRAIEGGLRPDPRATLPIVLQLLAGLGHAHEHGIVHRDVKPSNVFLPRGRPAKIMDFGVARLGEGSGATGVVGTPNYMSPEQVSGAAVDGRSDLFSAGLILYELVTGEKAYQADSVVALVYKIAHEEPDLSLVPLGGTWRQLRQVLAVALARDPAMRYPDAGRMQDELALALRDLGGTADWTTAADRGLAFRPPTATAPAADAETPVTAPAEVIERPSRLARAVTAVATVAGIAVIAAAAIMLLRSSRRPGSSLEATPIASATVPPATVTTRAAEPASSATPAAIPTAGPAPSVLATPRPPAPTESPRTAARETMEPPPSRVPGAPAEGRVDRANDLLEQGRYAAALAEARAVLRHDPGNAEAKIIAAEAEAATVVETRLRAAREALKRGDREAALAEVRAGLAVSSNDARLLSLFRELTQ